MRGVMDRLEPTVSESGARWSLWAAASGDAGSRGRVQIGTVPSQARVKRLCRGISELTSRRSTPPVSRVEGYASTVRRGAGRALSVLAR